MDEEHKKLDEEHKKKVRKKELRKKKTCEICQQVLEVETGQTEWMHWNLQHLKEQHMEGICVLTNDEFYDGWMFRCRTCGERYKNLKRAVYHVKWYCERCSITCEVCGSDSYGTSTIMSVL